MQRSRNLRWKLAAIAAATLGLSHNGFAAVTPIFDVGSSSASETHIAGTPSVSGSPYSTAITIGTPSAPQALVTDKITFPSGNSTGSTVATDGLSENSSPTSLQLAFASGTGVSQTDPGHAETASTLGCNFAAVWDIPSGSTFGPPISGSFSLPVGAKVGTGGSASFAFNVHWNMIVTTFSGDAVGPSSTTVYNDIRPAYAASVTYNKAGTYLTSFTAPAGAFNPPSITNPSESGETVQLEMTGAFFFSANNEDSPTLIEFPTVQDFPTIANNPKYDFTPGMGTGMSGGGGGMPPGMPKPPGPGMPKPPGPGPGMPPGMPPGMGGPGGGGGDGDASLSGSGLSASGLSGSAIVAAPEPSVAFLLAGAGAFLLARRKARR